MTTCSMDDGRRLQRTMFQWRACGFEASFVRQGFQYIHFLALGRRHSCLPSQLYGEEEASRTRAPSAAPADTPNSVSCASKPPTQWTAHKATTNAVTVAER